MTNWRWRSAMPTAVLIAGGLLTRGGPAVQAQPAFTFVHYFPDGGAAGSPNSALYVDSDGTFYGFGCRRDSVSTSTLFAVTPDDQSFWSGDIPGTSGATGGWTCNPDSATGEKALIQGWDGLLYGTTFEGGTAHRGSIFSVDRDLRDSFTILHEFTEGPDGCGPSTGLIQADDGNFYGTTQSGCGSGASNGTVYQLTPDGTFTTIHSFSQIEGEALAAPLIQASNGLLYGVTSADGPLGGGTVFAMTLDGSLTTLHAFPDGAGLGQSPRAGLLQASDGYLYGRTTGGPPGIFRMSLDGSEFATVHSFLYGSLPHFSLAEGLDQNLYGLVAGDPSADLGTIFSVGETPVGPYNALFIMPPFYRPYSGPLALGLDGALYGTTPAAGAAYPGTVFRFGALTVGRRNRHAPTTR